MVQGEPGDVQVCAGIAPGPEGGTGPGRGTGPGPPPPLVTPPESTFGSMHPKLGPDVWLANVMPQTESGRQQPYTATPAGSQFTGQSFVGSPG